MVEKLGLGPTFVHGPGYDRAGNTAGRVHGAAARILERFPAAHYVHCGSHALNLCIVSACKEQNICNMYSTLAHVLNKQILLYLCIYTYIYIYVHFDGGVDASAHVL